MASTWVDSTGGPLVLVPRSAVPEWGGVSAGYPVDEGDYDRACAVEDYIGLIDVGDSQALVLGDEPARTAFLPQQRVLVRVLAADPGVDVEATVEALLPLSAPDDTLPWEITEPLVLFDSSADGPTALREEHAVVDLFPGKYTVQAAYLDRPGVSVVLVQFVPDPD